MYKGNKQINIELNSSDDKVSEFSGNKTNFQKNNRIRQKLQMMQKTLKMMSDTKTTKSNWWRWLENNWQIQNVSS